ncbi:MAG TPA: AAA family ATPase, partial [Urbifossiella sp.]|nr:AAA family ATPase [Urbifossiella sp.]
MSAAPSVNHDAEAGAAHAPASLPARELAQQASQIARKVTAEVARVVVGAEDVTRQLLIALLAGGHVLLEGVPVVAKTTLSKVFARILGCQFNRVQFTPDLLPSDVTGTSVYDRNKNEFVLRHGPIFTQ